MIHRFLIRAAHERRQFVLTCIAAIALPTLYIAGYYFAVFAHGVSWISDVQARRLADTVYSPIKWSNRTFGKLPYAEQLFYRGQFLKIKWRNEERARQARMSLPR